MTIPSPSMRHIINGLRALHHARNVQLALIAAVWTLAATATVILMATAMDGFLHFSTPLRWAAALAILITAILGCFKTVRNACRRQSLQQLAAMAEETESKADNAIINAVQLFQNNPEADDFIQAILDENQVDPAQIPARKTYSARCYKPLAAVCPTLLFAGLLMFYLAPQRFDLALQRVLRPYEDIQPYLETRITEILPGDLTVRRGEDFTVTATLEGIIPEQTVVEWKIPAAGTHEATAMTRPTEDSMTFTLQFPPLFDDLSYRIIANDSTSDWATVTVDNPPGLETWQLNVTPPAYTQRQPYAFTAADETREIIGGSRITFQGTTSKDVTKATFLVNGKTCTEISQDEPFQNFMVETRAPFAGNLETTLETPQGMTARIKLPVTILPDKIPVVTLVNTPTAMKLKPGESFTVTFAAMDDYALESVAIEQLPSAGAPVNVATATPKVSEQRLFRARFVVDTKSFDLSQAPLKFRLRASETASEDPRRNGLSPVIVVSFFTPKEQDQNQKQKNQANEATLDRMLVLQKNALKNTNDLALKNAQGTALKVNHIAQMYSQQKAIRDMAIELLKNRDMLGIVGDTLAGMVNKEFTDALAAIDALNQSRPEKAVGDLQKVAVIQTRIIALLTNMNRKTLLSEEKHKGKADIFALIQRLVKDQNVIVRLSLAAQRKKPEEVDYAQLTNYQVDIAKTILAFNDKALKTAEEHAEDDFSAQLRKAVSAIEQEKTYGYAMEAADLLDARETKDAIQAEKNTLKGLAKAYTILNQWRINNAKKTIQDAKSTIAEVKEALKGIEQTQARIAEIARELQKRGLPDDDPTLKDDMEKMEKEHEKMLDLLERLANDLYQFPDLPVCNELNTKMREIFEDVLQAKDSEKLKAVEIAVQKEDSLLDLIRSTTERIDDVEMWLPDVPDHFVWNMESFDADEFPEMPLVELPEELQDIVGELLEQDQEIDAMSQDTTGNNMVADMEMGWAVMDGPMPSFSAKGKSGNTRPNDNEMTGRSGSGREGQSTGELVENHVKGYEGRKTHARKTNDKFQKGQVTEDKDSTMDARSTGGGKLGGDSESIGMFGNTVRRDLHRSDHGKSPRQLRQETDVLFAKARLLYVNPGSLGEVAHHLSGIGKNPPNLRSFDPMKRKIVRRLSDSVIEMKEGTVLPMPVDAVLKHNANSAEQRRGENISDEYKSQLNSYFKSLSN